MTDPTIPSSTGTSAARLPEHELAGDESGVWPLGQESGTIGPGQGQPAGSGATTVKAGAGKVKDTAAAEAQNVAGTAKGQAQGVASEVGQQTRQLLSQTSSELSSQAGVQQNRLADGLSSYAGELRSMALNSEGHGVMTDLVHQAADRGERAASYLSEREPRDLLADVRSFARRRPVAFLGIAAGAGILVGRFSRGLFADAKGGDPALKSSSSSVAGSADAGSVPPSRPSASLEEIPTSGTSAGPTYADPLTGPYPDAVVGPVETVADPQAPLSGGVDRGLDR